jgi:hypothetical protein
MFKSGRFFTNDEVFIMLEKKYEYAQECKNFGKKVIKVKNKEFNFRILQKLSTQC